MRTFLTRRIKASDSYSIHSVKGKGDEGIKKMPAYHFSSEENVSLQAREADHVLLDLRI